MDIMSANVDQLATALAAAQAEMGTVKKNADNPYFNSRYADLAACFEAVRSIFPKHGLAITQSLVPQDDLSYICVRTTLLHSSGQWLASDCVLNSNAAKAKNPAQAAGSAITYARRYGLAALVGIVTDEDDDGNACEAHRTIPSKQQAPRQQAQPQHSATWTAFQQFCKSHYKTREAFSNDVSAFFGRKIESTDALTDAEMADFMEAKNANA